LTTKINDEWQASKSLSYKLHN